MKDEQSGSPLSKDASMPDLRRYGSPPYSVALIHGGPGGAGGMAPVARTLTQDFGVLEPLITDHSLQGQIDSLTKLLANETSAPTTLVGHSYGSWLSVMVAANSPEMVNKLILVSSGAFTTEGAADIEHERRSRLTNEDRRESERLGLSFQSASAEEKEDIWLRYGQLCLKSDGYATIDAPNEILPGGAAVFQAVWPEVAVQRDNGRLLQLTKDLDCPVVVIHGDHDPQPVSGVAQPLETVIDDLRCEVLANCGHTPWLERDAQSDFYELLKREISAV